VITLALIFSERLNRTIVAMAGAALMVGAGRLLGFYDEQSALTAIDLSTLGLLLGMMLLVALLQPTGFFQFLAILAGRLSRGNPVRLLVLLGSVTTVLSMFLDNVTTVVLVAPVTILISEILGINPAPFLITEALLSNTGGTGTLVGDPPNVIIGVEANLTFADFLANALPIVLVAWVIALALLLLMFRKELSHRPRGLEAVAALDPAKALDDPRTAGRVLAVLTGAVLLFFVHHLLHLSPTFIALSAAAIALVWVRPDMERTLARIEWPVLIFFAALFVLVGGLEHSGLLARAANLLSGADQVHPTVLGISLIWIVAALSAIVDNIPITITLVPVIKGMAGTGVDITPLWWALVFGAGFGGNGTIIGSTANIFVVSLSEKTRHPITAGLWSRRGLPVMLVVCIVASIMYALFLPALADGR
jgi:Na+/H+ antiporter NhaD/arsenite permease-like protein